MSTYYKFYCETCKESGGHLTSQAWGTGNFDIISTFKFSMHHATTCGPENVRMAVESSLEYGYRKTPMSKMDGIFPSSDDWEFICSRKGQNWPDVRQAWEAENK